MDVDGVGGDLRDDQALLDAVGRGDQGAFRVLYERHAPWLFLRLSRRCADRNVVEEVVQDAFTAVWKRPHSYRGAGEVAAWIWGIGVRRLIDQLRRSTRASQRLPAPELGRPSAEEEVLLGIGYGDLAGAMNGLSPELRAVLQATALDGLTMREAGRLLGIPTGTVKTRLMRARAEIRGALV
jgi:RNA polymerase sigma-70 factor (ECF subfamily)